MSLPEVLLWTQLRSKRLAHVRFRRQHPVGPYILDFHCPSARLAIEIDGRSHDDPKRAMHDARRSEWLEAQGIATLRLPASDVLDERALEGVLASIDAMAGERCA